MIHKGVRVRVKAKVRTGFECYPGETIIYKPENGDKMLIRRSINYLNEINEREYQEVIGHVVGYTFRFTGRYHASTYDYHGEYDQAFLGPDKGHRVWLVEWEGLGDRYTKPSMCLEEDLEVIDQSSELQDILHRLEDIRMRLKELEW